MYKPENDIDVVEALVWLYANKKSTWLIEVFDYPNYCGIPEHLVLRLSTDDVDYIQEQQEFEE